MSGVLIALVEKLPAGFLMGFLPLLCVAAVWVFSHIRIDKQGKRYWYSQKYEDTKRNRKQDVILNSCARVDKMVNELQQDVLQLQICPDLPDTAQREAFWRYKERGYNSWVDQDVVDRGLFTKEEVSYISNKCKEAGSEDRSTAPRSKTVL